MLDIIKDIVWQLRPKKIYGLVGPPGTGKSFRSFLIADKYNIEYIIDDGLLISRQQIIAGKSAKREKFQVTAVKRAIFHETKHAREVRKELYKRRFQSVLILSTSEGMLNKIIKRLHLPRAFKIIKIEDIATEQEIELAQKSRINDGKHVIPIPLIEVKKQYPNMVLHAINMFIDEPRGFFFKKKKKQLIEKTIVRPDFGSQGSVSISETALVQMVTHCIAEYSRDVHLIKAKIIESAEGFVLALDLKVGYDTNTPNKLYELQKEIQNKIQNFTGIKILRVDIDITQIS